MLLYKIINHIYKTKMATAIFYLFFIMILFMPSSAHAQRADHEVNIYFFRGEGCPHCAAEENFLKTLTAEFKNIQVHDFEIWFNSDNAKLASQVAQEMNVQMGGVPLTVIGERVTSGYLSDDVTGAEIRRAVEYYTAVGDPNVVGDIISKKENKVSNNSGNDIDNILKKNWPKTIPVPFFGTIKTQNFSILGLSVVIGIIDGFNPCAMWVLLFLISMFLGMKNRWRMWALGLSFIGASALVYFMFMVAWLNIFLFIGFLFWIRLSVALVALGTGYYHVREYIRNKNGTCEVIDEQKRTKIFNQVKDIIQRKSFILALAGIISLATAVNMIELICSAGLPAIYTSILAASNLSAWQYYGYVLIYIFFFMLDDIIIFVVAMITLRVMGITEKYVRVANLVGGIIMLIIGLLLIFKPNWLLFG